MAELETIIQRFETDTAQSEAALDQMQRDLLQTGQVSDQASAKLSRGMASASTGFVRSAGNVTRSTGLMRGGMQQLSFQLQDVIVGLQAGQRPMTVFAQQGSQILSAFGPWGAVLGVGAAAVGGLATALITAGGDAEDTTTAIEDLTKKFQELGDSSEDVDKLVKSMEDLTGLSEKLARAEIGREAEKAGSAATKAGADIATFFRDLVVRIESSSNAATQDLRELGLTFDEILKERPDLFSEFDVGNLQAVRDALEEVRGRTEFSNEELDALRETILRFQETAPESFSGTITKLDTLSTALIATRTEAEGLNEAFKRFAGQEAFSEIESRGRSQSLSGGSNRDVQEFLRRRERERLKRLEEQRPDFTPLPPRSREDAQDFGLKSVSVERGGSDSFADDLEELRRLSQEATQAQKELHDQGVATAQDLAFEYDIALETGTIFANTLSSGLTDALFTTGSLTEKIGAMGESLAKAVLQAIIFRSIMAAIGSPASGNTAATGLFGAFGGGGATTGAVSGGAGAPGRASGGPVSAGMAYMVGERGPELFVPGASGSIVPNGQMAGPKITVIDQRGAQAPPVESNVDPNGAITFRIRGEVAGMGQDGSLQRMLGVPRRGVTRG